MKKRRIEIKTTPEIRQALENERSESGLSFTQIIEAALTDFLKKPSFEAESEKILNFVFEEIQVLEHWLEIPGLDTAKNNEFKNIMDNVYQLLIRAELVKQNPDAYTSDPELIRQFGFEGDKRVFKHAYSSIDKKLIDKLLKR